MRIDANSIDLFFIVIVQIGGAFTFVRQ